MEYVFEKGRPRILFASMLAFGIHLSIMVLIYAFTGKFTYHIDLFGHSLNVPYLSEPFIYVPLYALFFGLYYSEDKSMVKRFGLFRRAWRKKAYKTMEFWLFMAGIISAILLAGIIEVSFENGGSYAPILIAGTLGTFALSAIFKRAFGLLFLFVLVTLGMKEGDLRLPAILLSLGIIFSFVIYSSIMLMRCVYLNRKEKRRRERIWSSS